MKCNYDKKNWRRDVGIFTAIVVVALTLILAILPSSDNSLNLSQSALISFILILAQFISSYCFGSHQKPSAATKTLIARQLLSVGGRISSSRHGVEDAHNELNTLAANTRNATTKSWATLANNIFDSLEKADTGATSVRLSHAEEDFIDLTKNLFEVLHLTELGEED